MFDLQISYDFPSTWEGWTWDSQTLQEKHFFKQVTNQCIRFQFFGFSMLKDNWIFQCPEHQVLGFSKEWLSNCNRLPSHYCFHVSSTCFISGINPPQQNRNSNIRIQILHIWLKLNYVCILPWCFEVSTNAHLCNVIWCLCWMWSLTFMWFVTFTFYSHSS